MKWFLPRYYLPGNYLHFCLQNLSEVLMVLSLLLYNIVKKSKLKMKNSEKQIEMLMTSHVDLSERFSQYFRHSNHMHESRFKFSGAEAGIQHQRKKLSAWWQTNCNPGIKEKKYVYLGKGVNTAKWQNGIQDSKWKLFCSVEEQTCKENSRKSPAKGHREPKCQWSPWLVRLSLDQRWFIIRTKATDSAISYKAVRP